VRAGGSWAGQTAVRFAMRAGPTPEAVSLLPFVDADDEGELSAPIRGRFVQVEVRLAGPGWDTPRVRDLRIVGRRCRRCAEVDPSTCPEVRVSDDIVALWRFDQGTLVRDISGYRVHDLITPTLPPVSWGMGYVDIDGARFIVDRPITEIAEALEGAAGLTVEAWVRPRDDTQDGPARILTISEDVDSRNLTLGQEGDVFECRLRRVGAESGDPYVVSADGSVAGGSLQHVVLTRAADGATQFYVDGVPSGDAESHPEAIGDWDLTLRLLVGNENDGTRPWAGEIHLIAIYRRGLDADEIARHHRIGPGAGGL
jgi:hypothetical protein